MKFDFDRLPAFLRKRSDAPEVIDLIGRQPDQINRSEYLGFVTFKDCGISILFKEAPWVVPAMEICNPKMLYLNGFHFFRAGYEGHSQYAGQFPNGISFGDTEAEVVRKMGQPIAIGGGGFSNLLKKPIPRWLKYHLAGDMLHFQLDANSNIEMITLYTPDLQLNSTRNS